MLCSEVFLIFYTYMVQKMIKDPISLNKSIILLALILVNWDYRAKFDQLKLPSQIRIPNRDRNKNRILIYVRFTRLFLISRKPEKMLLINKENEHK